MDNKLILIQCITLLYRESEVKTGSDSSKFIRPIIESIVLPDTSIGVINSERDLLVSLKQICLDMCDNVDRRHYDKLDLIQKVKYACREDALLADSFEKGVLPDLSEDQIKKLCVSIRSSIKQASNTKAIDTIIQKAAYDLKFNRDKITNIHEFIDKVNSEIEPYKKVTTDKDPAIVSEASSGDNDTMTNAIKEGKDLNDERGMLVTGWQGFNRMVQGGIRRGECVVVGALQHNYKTGFTLSLFKQFALYNKPYMRDETKKPLLVHISFENSLALNMPFLYKNLYENETLQPADLNSLSDEQIAHYIKEKLSKTGYEFRFIHINPSMWTYLDMFDYLMSLESEGYEIHALVVDYLNMLPKTGCDLSGPQGSNIRDLFRRVRNFCAARKIAFITPHQLSTEAKMLIRNGLEDTFVKEIANKGYWDSCKTIDQEVDLEIYIHIVKVDGRSYLTIQRGKHRLITQTKNEYLYCVLPFEDVGDIRDDLGKPDTTRKKPGHGPIGSSNSVPFWDFEPQAA